MLPLLFAALCAVPLAGVQPAPTAPIRATMLATNPIQGRVNAATGEVTGVVADLMRELARRRGGSYTLTPLPDAASVIESIRVGRADIGFLAIEAARATQVDFSAPYLMMRNGYLVRTGSPFVRSADVDRLGITVGAVKGQSQQIFVSENLKQAEVRVLPAMPSNEALVTQMTSGELDVFAANRQRMNEVAALSPRVKVLDDDFLLIGQAIVVAKGDAAALKEMNQFVAAVRASGFVAAAIERAGLTASARP